MDLHPRVCRDSSPSVSLLKKQTCFKYSCGNSALIQCGFATISFWEAWNIFCKFFHILNDLRRKRQCKNKYILKKKPEIIYFIEFFQSTVNSTVVVDNHAKIILIFSLAVSMYLCSWSRSKLQSPDDRFNEIGYVLKKGKRTENSFGRCLKTTQQLLGTPSTAFLLKEYSRGNFLSAKEIVFPITVPSTWEAVTLKIKIFTFLKDISPESCSYTWGEKKNRYFLCLMIFKLCLFSRILMAYVLPGFHFILANTLNRKHSKQVKKKNHLWTIINGFLPMTGHDTEKNLWWPSFLYTHLSLPGVHW